jgi:hypothetical protein
MSDAADTFSDRELRRIAAFHLWEAAKRTASVASRATDPVLRADLEGVADWLQQAHRRLSSEDPTAGELA